MISQKALEEYKKIYQKQYGKTISDADALEQATKLLNLMKIVYKPMTKEEFDRVSKEQAKPLEPVQ